MTLDMCLQFQMKIWMNLKPSSNVRVTMKVNVTSSNSGLKSIFKHPDQIITMDARGEVKALAYIAVEELPYFAANDSNAIQLVEKAEEWTTGLDNVQAIKMYELIYYLHNMNFGDKKSLRMLYKYQYNLTPYEKRNNPEWGQFVEGMDSLYSCVLDEN
jgi:hypothetical protein